MGVLGSLWLLLFFLVTLLIWFLRVPWTKWYHSWSHGGSWGGAWGPPLAHVSSRTTTMYYYNQRGRQTFCQQIHQVEALTKWAIFCTGHSKMHFLNTLRPRRNCCRFADNTSKCIIFLNENVIILIKKFHWSLFLRVQLTVFQNCFR